MPFLQATQPPLPWLAASAVWLFTIGLALWLFFFFGDPRATWAFSEWASVPGQLVATVLVLWQLRQSTLSVELRRGWQLVLAYIVLNAAANVVWIETWQVTRNPDLIAADVLYLWDYLLLTGAFLLFHQAQVGLRQGLPFWRDVTILGIAMLAAEWTFLFQPYLVAPESRALSMLTTSVYAFASTLMLSVGAVSFIGCIGSRRLWPVMPLLGAALAVGGWQIAWLARKFAGVAYNGLFYNFGDVIAFACLCTAAAHAAEAGAAPDNQDGLEANAFGFLPALLLLTALALLAGTANANDTAVEWVKVALIVLGGAMLVSRQESLRRKVNHLHRQIALREADERVAELIAQTHSLLLIVDSRREMTFASPAMLDLLGLQAKDLPKSFDAGRNEINRSRELRQLIEHLFDASNSPRQIEMSMLVAGRPRTYQVAGVSQISNPLLGGLVLSFVDVTAHRELERDIVAASAQERLRLASEVHEGLGQELTGISLLLKHLARHPLQGAQQREDFDTVVERVNLTIGLTRQLAMELAPVSISRGSLTEALEHLVQETAGRTGLRVNLLSSVETGLLHADPSDHVYRIAHEGINNAARHSGCQQIDVALERRGETLVLKVEDDGCGFDIGRTKNQGFGLRIMNYRARLIGANLSIARDGKTGTILQLSVPVKAPGDLKPCGETTPV